MFLHEDPGPRNQIVIFAHNGAGNTGSDSSTNPFTSQTITWTCPSDVNDSVPMRVYVWGGGGASGCGGSSGNGYGGGGGGLAISEYTPVAGQAYTVTIAGMQYTYNGVGNSSSFSGSGIVTTSASGGRSGYNNTNPTGYATGESANPQNDVYGQGGVGVGGNIVNRRGGRGGTGTLNASTGQGGGGGSAPSPTGLRDGFRGGNATNYSGAGGASINFKGTDTYTSYNTGGGAGTAGPGTSGQNSDGHKSAGGCGGAGLMGAGGTGAYAGNYSTSAKQHTPPGDGKGGALWLPNQILLGGGGGGGGAACSSTSSMSSCTGGCGGPGAGGGGSQCYSSSTNNAYQIAGNGGVLGGGGGGPQYSTGGNGGIAGGGGGSGYGHSGYAYSRSMHGCGGGGLIVIQYAVNV